MDIEFVKLIVMTCVMLVSGMFILFLGYKKKVDNKLLWALVPLSRGIEWFFEVLSYYYEEFLDVDDFLDPYELSSAFFAALVLVAVCLEFNGVVERPLGKLLAILMGVVPIFLLLVIDFEVMEEVEDFLLYESDAIEVDPLRLLYGFIIPIIAATLLLATHVVYMREVKKEMIPKDDKMHLKVGLMVGLILLTSIFNGFDYEESFEAEMLFTSFRAVTMIPFIILPLIVILSNKADLHLFIIIKNSGIPIYAYDFKKDSELIGDNFIFLTSGFLSALTSFSGEITSRKSGSAIVIRSNNLYYLVYRTTDNIYALQASYQNKQLENGFNQVVSQLDARIQSKEEMSAFEEIEVKNIIRQTLADFI